MFYIQINRRVLAENQQQQKVSKKNLVAIYLFLFSEFPNIYYPISRALKIRKPFYKIPKKKVNFSFIFNKIPLEALRVKNKIKGL